jgi:murein DD-endopeptidase MepM/ murein hydrolase activator NlpD
MSFRRAATLLGLCLGLVVTAPAAASASSSGDDGAAGPRASQFLVSPARLRTTGGALTVHFRVEAATAVRVGLTLTRRGARRPSLRLRLGWLEAGRPYTRTVRVAAGSLAPGAYVVALSAVDAAGRRVRTARASGPGGAKIVRVTGPAATPAPAPARAPAPAPAPPPPAPAPVAPAPGAGVFPVQGTWSFGAEGSRFGAGRTGHTHQGQDIAAAAGTPVVAPVAGTITRVAFQASGAGHYVVLRAADGRDMVFMHFQAASSVPQGTPVAAGTLIGRVGSSGGTSSGPHLHFEIWPDGWYAGVNSKPIDPLPTLTAWAGTR